MEIVKRKILLVDDEQNNLDYMKRCLHSSNYEITTCINPVEALEVIKTDCFDIIISDQKMPQLNGVEFFQRAEEISPESIKIMVTAYSDADMLIDSINKAKIYRYIKKPFSPDEINVIVTSAIEYIELKEHNKSLVNDLKDLFSGTINAIVEALDAKDSFTLGRSRRVTFYSLKIAEELKLSKHLVGELELAGLLHDIGMIGVNDEILYKTDKLTQEEYDEIKKHVAHGIRILEDINQLKEVIDIIRYHHEHYDGTGYPYGFKGEEIPLLSRIISITDAYDSMVSNRAYRKSLTTDEAVKVLKELSGIQFDPEITKIFIEILPNLNKEIKAFEEMSKME